MKKLRQFKTLQTTTSIVVWGHHDDDDDYFTPPEDDVLVSLSKQQATMITMTQSPFDGLPNLRRKGALGPAG
jgi:hypothetical protein